MRIFSRSPQLLPCTLTPAEFNEKASELAHTIGKLRETLAAQELRKKEMKLELAEIEATRDALAQIVATREEHRLIDVALHANDVTGRVSVVRMDTGEVTTERAMSPEERQISADLH